MRRFALACVAAAAFSCDYSPPGQCSEDKECGYGVACQTGVCVSCAFGICDATGTVSAAQGADLVLHALAYNGAATLRVTFSKNALAADTAVTLHYRDSAGLPPPPHSGKYYTALDIGVPGTAQFGASVRLSGNNLTKLPSASNLNIAELRDGAWADVATALIGGNGIFRSMRATAALPGIKEPGTYLIYIPAEGSDLAIADFGVAVVPNDGLGQAGLQVVSLFDDDGNVNPKPPISYVRNFEAVDLDGAALTPDGRQGILVDGANYVVFFSDIFTGAPTVSPTKLDITNYGGDGDSVAIFPNGDEAVLSGDDDHRLVVISGILAGHPAFAETVPIPSTRDGLVISNDGEVMLARGPTGVTLFAMSSIPAVTGSLGAKLTHSFTQIHDYPDAPFPLADDGRDGLAISPVDSSRAVVIGGSPASSKPVISLFTGLPGSPASPPPTPAEVQITGAHEAYAVSITADGKTAVVGTDAGLAVFSGVDTGALTQVGALFNPQFTVGATSMPLGLVTTLGITLDGKYVVALTQTPAPDSGTLLMFPLVNNVLQPAVAQVNGLAIPFNDSVVMH
jgi:hypothetical protein